MIAPHRRDVVHMGYPDETRERARELLAGGMSCRAVSAEVGVSHGLVWQWNQRWGIPLLRGRTGGADMGVCPVVAQEGPRPSPRARVTYAERVLIADRLRHGRSCRQIAAELGVAHTTVAREVRGHARGGRYDPASAQRACERARSRPRSRRLDLDPGLRAYVVRGLSLGWSPEQVSRRMRDDFCDNGRMRISHEAIYQALYVQGRGSLRQELAVEQALRSGRTSRKPRSRLPERRGRKSWVEGAEISLRPAEADDRAVPGHWEGDLVVGGATCLVTLVERSTRFLLMSRLDSHDAATVADRLAAMVSGLPDALSRTLTWDQGVEMARVADFEEATGFRVFFCDPRSPWQRGSNENTNGLVRQYFPKGTRFDGVGDDEVAEVQDLPDGRPRKTLGWRTPAEALDEVLSAGAIQS